ncbi:MAG: aminotransferase class IV [Acidobacteria bacterium]|nr:aminotransferase class IV [Acidobacteriota bacterium]
MSLSWWNGRTVPAGEVHISPDDSGFLFGDGLFETLRVDDGRARDVEAHLDRLLAGLRRVEIELPEDRRALEAAVAEVAAAAPRPVARLRITVTRGARLVTTASYEPPEENLYRQGVFVRLLPAYRIDSGGPLAGLKSLCYQGNRLALRQAESRGDWEALLLNEHGRLVEGSRCNLAVVLADRVFTPPASDGCLPGTVRRRLLETGAIEERPLSPGDLAAAGEVLLMNSLIGVLPVSRIDGQEIPVGPTAERLRRAWAARLPPPA